MNLMRFSLPQIFSSLVITLPALAENIAPTGTAILGLDNPSAIGQPSTSQAELYINSDPRAATTHLMTWINDGEIDSGFADTWSGTSSRFSAGVDFVGITDLKLPKGASIRAVVFHGITFKDGGWFGKNGSNDTQQAIAPQVQASTDNGTTWYNVSSVRNDYTEQLTKAGLNAPNVTTTFTFPPIQNINAIRLIGTTGGNTRTDTSGFIGVKELQVLTHSPVNQHTAAALISIGSIKLTLQSN